MRRPFCLLLLSLCLLGTAALAQDASSRGRPDGSNLPPPRHWQGNMDDFDPGFWQHGSWRHGLHNGRMGWWYKVRMDWFGFEEPVFPHPDLLIPPGQAAGWWYWCDAAQDYYPYVTLCPGPWSQVAPRLLGPS